MVRDFIDTDREATQLATTKNQFDSDGVTAPFPQPNDWSDNDSGCGQLEVRCPNCHEPMKVAVDTRLTDLTCSSCGSHFSLVDQSQATRMAPSLSKMGRFDLIERIGVGGFGSVWKARDKELDRTVAVKIPRQGGMTPEEQEKFFREARAAAQLRHPNVVSVHEVGRDGDSVYIVSDFVRGVTLGDWLTGQQLTSREAAELCAKVADALHHAHEQGIVHRDLKPANIMMDYDGQPHIMDFGLARRETGEVTMTMDGQVLGTPAYMSPEQADGEGHKADRRSDVYSLGVILFQLLTGELPFRGNARMLIKQVIQDDPPSPRKLNGNVPRDLETITLKCLEKAPDRRYESARSFAEELHRFLSDEPIVARPNSRAERMVKWIRRNKAVSVLSSVVALTLACGTIAATYFAIDARRQAAMAISRQQEADAARQDALVRQKEAEQARADEARARKEAEAVTDFLVNALASPDPKRDGRTITVAEVLDRAQQRLQEELSDQPLTQAALLSAIGSSKHGLGLFDESVEPKSRAMKLRQQTLGANHLDTLWSMNALADAYTRADRINEAIPLLETALTAWRENYGADHNGSLTAMNLLGNAYKLSDRPDEAIPLYETALARQRETLGADHYRTLLSMANLANAYNAAGRMSEAIPLLETVVAKWREELGADHPTTLSIMNFLGNAYRLSGRTDEAIPLYETVLAKRREKLGADHHDTRVAVRNLARALVNSGRTGEALQLSIQNGEYLAALDASKCADHELTHTLIDSAVAHDVGKIRDFLDQLVVGELRLVAGHLESAEAAIRASMAGLDAPPVYCYKSLGIALFAQGKLDEATQAFRDALATVRQEDGTFKLERANIDEMTAAYFLDLISQDEYAAMRKDSKDLACFPWFFIGQRKEFEGDRQGALSAYKRSVELGDDETAHRIRGLSKWKLEELTKATANSP